MKKLLLILMLMTFIGVAHADYEQVWTVLRGGTGTTTSTGTGSVVLSNSPSLVTPVLGAATATTINGITIPSTTDTAALLGTAQTFTKGNRVTPVTVAISVATFTPDFNASNNHNITLVHASCPCTLANPSNIVAGQSGIIVVNQSATGSDLINTYGGDYVFTNSSAPVLSTTASAVDELSYYVVDSTHIRISPITSTLSTTGTGSTYVLSTSPTLVTPALGTPSALVGTNISGTAASFTAGAVSTINGLITNGSNVTITGSGTSGSPYSIAAAGTTSLAGLTTDVKTDYVTDTYMFLGSGAGAVESGGHADTALGISALHAVLAGSYNTAMGYQSLKAETSGGSNTAMGYQSEYTQNGGSNNTAIGLQSCYSVTSGTNDTCLGASADVNSGGSTNRTSIGYSASATADNTVQLGNNSVTAVNTAGAYKGAGVISTGTKFTITGCSAGTTIGGSYAGSFVSGTTGTCTAVVTINGATGLTAPNGWSCWSSDETTGNLFRQTASNTTTATFSGTTVTNDVVTFGCVGY